MAVFAVVASSTVVRGGAVLLSQQRELKVELGVVTRQTFVKNAPGFGHFDDSIEKVLDEVIDVGSTGNPPLLSHIHAETTATQDSRIAPSLMNITGLLHADTFDDESGAQPVFASFIFDVLFRLDSPHDFNLFFEPGVKENQGSMTMDAALVRTETSEQIFAADVTSIGFEGDPHEVPVHLNGVLPSGNYHLFFSAEAGVGEGDHLNYKNFELRLDLAPQSAAVPLPAAVWGGLVGIALLGATAMSRSHAALRARR